MKVFPLCYKQVSNLLCAHLSSCVILRKLDGQGHFLKTILNLLLIKVFDKDIGKLLNFKAKYFLIISLLSVSAWPKYQISKLKAYLMDNVFNTQTL